VEERLHPEQRARVEIDRMLAEAGWVVQDYRAIDLTAGRGIAAREVPTKTGPVDYLLFGDGKALGTIEAKKQGETLRGVEWQTERYTQGFSELVKERPIPHWEPLPLAFHYQSTGAETLFTNLRDPIARPRDVFHFHRPGTLVAWAQEEFSLLARLRRMPALDPDGLRDVQTRAIEGLEESLRNVLLRHRPRSISLLSQPGGFEGFGQPEVTLELHDLASEQGEDPAARRRVELDAALAASRLEPPKSQNAITEIADFGGVEPEVLKGLVRVVEPRANPVVASVRPSLGPTDDRGGKGDLGVHIREQLLDLTASECVESPPHYLDVLPRHRPRSISLLPQPGGFEGFSLALKVLDANDFAVAECVGARTAGDHLDTSRAAGEDPLRDHDLILPDADELLWFEPITRPRLPKEGQILAKPIATAINGPVEDRIRIVHLDGGIEEIIEALVIGICENQVLPLLVDPPHDLHVLLRHRPRSISRIRVRRRRFCAAHWASEPERRPKKTDRPTPAARRLRGPRHG
jgi:hypothetical protein